MKISYLPSGFLINGLRKLEDIERVESSFFLRAVRIENNSSNKIQSEVSFGQPCPCGTGGD